MDILISIIIPVYNAEKYIDECIRSTINQTYPKLDIVIVDDGSKDRSLEIAKSYEVQDSRVRVFTKENSGVSSTRNYGIRQARGDLLLFLDSDDWLELNCISKLTNEIMKYNTDLVACDFIVDNGKKKKKDCFFEIDSNYIYHNENINLLISSCIDPHAYGKINKITNFGVPWAKLYRKNIITQYNIAFPENISHMEDMIFNIKYLSHCESVAYIHKNLYNYRIRPNSLVNSFSRQFQNEVIYIGKFLDTDEYLLENMEWFKKVIKYKKFCLYYETLRRSIVPDNTIDFMQKKNKIEKLNKHLNGSYCKEISHWFSKTQLLYGGLNYSKRYCFLLVIFIYLQKIKSLRKLII